MGQRSRETRPSEASRCVITDQRGLFPKAVAAALELDGIEAGTAPFNRADAMAVVFGKNHLVAPPVVVAGMTARTVATGLDIIEALTDGGAPVVVLADSDVDEIVLAEAMAHGVAAIEATSGPLEDLTRAVRTAAVGETSIPLRRRYELENAVRSHRSAMAEKMRPFTTLTDRERQVLAAMMHGRRADQIADESFVSISTVRSQIRSVLVKLDVHSQLEAVALAHDADWSHEVAAG